MSELRIAENDPLLLRIRSEFREMPGLCLTEAQAARLWNLDSTTVQLALETLVDTGFLVRKEDGRYVGSL